MAISSVAERDLYWAIKTAQSDGLSLDEYLKKVREYWLAEREEQIYRERKGD